MIRGGTKMAISNHICLNCEHQLICNKVSVLEKFDDDNKKFIDMDITIDNCKDFMNIKDEDCENSDEGNE